jgi:predicted nucleotidyltransferase
MAQATAPVAIPDIQKLADQIVERFKPCRVILFGSYATGTPTADSDVICWWSWQTRRDGEKLPASNPNAKLNFP